MSDLEPETSPNPALLILSYPSAMPFLRLLTSQLEAQGWSVHLVLSEGDLQRSIQEEHPLALLCLDNFVFSAHFKMPENIPIFFVSFLKSLEEQKDLFDQIHALLVSNETKNTDVVQEKEIESPEVSSFAKDLDPLVLEDLRKLGGDPFLLEIVTQFSSDAVSLLSQLMQAAQNKDVTRFKDYAHALRSCSANIGAQRLYKLCLSWRDVSAEDLIRNSHLYMVDLQEAFDQAQQAFDAYLKHQGIGLSPNERKTD